MFQSPVCPLPPTPHALTQLRACPSIWLTQVFEDYFSLIDVLLCFTFPEIDVIPSLHTREYVCQHFFSPWIMNNNWCCICCIFPIHTFSYDKVFVEIDVISHDAPYYTNFPRIKYYPVLRIFYITWWGKNSQRTDMISLCTPVRKKKVLSILNSQSVRMYVCLSRFLWWG